MKTSQLHVVLSCLLFAAFILCKDVNRTMYSNGLLHRVPSSGEKSHVSSKSRVKRSATKTENWTIDASCNCCQSYCTLESFSEAYSLTSGKCPVGQMCCLIKQSPIQWKSQNCSTSDMSFSVNCTCVGNCGGNNRHYYCECLQGYNYICAASQTNTNALTAVLVLVALLPTLTIFAVLTYGYLRYRKRKIVTHAYQHNKMPTKCMKSSILIIVGNRDELKIYSEQLATALETLGGTRKRLNVKIINIFHLYIDRYQVECDKVVFFLDTENKANGHHVSICMEKIKFMKGQQNSTALIYFDRTNRPQGNVRESENSATCLVSSIKEIEKWLPFITRIIFNINHKETTEHNLSRRHTYFIRSLVESNDTSERYIKLLNNILDTCGARKAQSEDQAKCKILVVNSFNEITGSNIQECKRFNIFSAINHMPAADIYQSMTTSMYCREQIMIGIFRVLLQLHIIK